MTQGWPVPDLDRDRLVGVAYRMLGTVADAEDAVQEAFVRWYRLDGTARAAVGNPVGWFVRTTSRICLDVLKSAPRRRERYVGPWLPEPVPDGRYGVPAPRDDDPELRAVRAESVSLALLTVMESMTPAERVAFVLRDVFGYPVAEIAEVLGRSPGAVRQLASSARARVAAAGPAADGGASARLTATFRQAANTGDVTALVRLLHPEVTLRSDGGGIVRAALNPVRGADKVARFLVGVLARQSPVVLAGPGNGRVLTFEHDGAVTGVLELVVRDGVVVDVLVQWNPHKLAQWPGGRT
ncbi:RNA polymerase sigma factor SigJ [Promicromonospora thailandica]|uniref:RNA polymerase sigma-70 factor, ECF subfamily n=1 Tax=Promicromonospora thailandica TaxID=765201 RepID=A0A9X2G4Z1_9MICO|nr:RNA polymerase sigma factor SigJ [Promicromonospora thailandica]MCP2265805.1 RNA polymerase sigma-70 factor, ECF subfamily [Promicromonospora thailandica]BFF21833.1 RNA polymerase sigma factor SigJ [Promicromonospora thailandica]